MDNANATTDDSKSLVLDQYDTLRILYGDILRGYSFYNPEKIYIKHFSEEDSLKIVRKKHQLIHEFSSLGVPTEKERLQTVRESGDWTQEDDDFISEKQFNISDNEKILKTVSITSQRKSLEEVIKNWRMELAAKLSEKESLIGVTAESRATRISHNFFVYYAFYKDPECKEEFWEKKEFEEMDEDILIKYLKIYNNELNCFSDRSLRKISCLPIALNAASYCKDQGMFFYGKPVTKFTTYQMAVYAKIMRNTFVLRESKDDPPDINNDLTMQELLNWYDQAYASVTMPGGNAGVTETNQEFKSGSRRSMTFN